jgi:hypothetical protein
MSTVWRKAQQCHIGYEAAPRFLLNEAACEASQEWYMGVGLSERGAAEE